MMNDDQIMEHLIATRHIALMLAEKASFLINELAMRQLTPEQIAELSGVPDRTKPKTFGRNLQEVPDGERG